MWPTHGCPFIVDFGTHAYQCNASDRLSAWMARVGPPNVSELALDRGMHLLLYGTSQMRQIGMPIVCHNAASMGRTEPRAKPQSCNVVIERKKEF